MKAKILQYAGSKYNFIDTINSTLNTKCSTFVEPFVGSGAVFANVPEYEKYVINDKDEVLISIYRSILLNTYDTYKKTIAVINSMYGDISRNKSAYYAFRDECNRRYFVDGKYQEDGISGLMMMHLYNSCINALARFGPNGFNQSYGRRLIIADNYSYNKFRDRLQRTTLCNEDGITLTSMLLSLSENNSYIQLFLDPPYFARNSGSYSSTDERQFNNILSLFTMAENVSYTDAYHQLHSTLKVDGSQILRKMGSVSPNRASKQKSDTYEILLHKIAK